MGLENKIIKIGETEFVISPQAQMVIEESKHDYKVFTEWLKTSHSKIAIGGNHATLFLEHMHRKKKEIDNGSTPS